MIDLSGIRELAPRLGRHARREHDDDLATKQPLMESEGLFALAAERQMRTRLHRRAPSMLRLPCLMPCHASPSASGRVLGSAADFIPAAPAATLPPGQGAPRHTQDV